MKLPLAKILKGKLLRVAEMQDLVILELARKFDFVLHGGAAVWRVYGGKRFSFDLDIYHENPKEVASFLKNSKMLKLTKSREASSGLFYLRVKDSEEIEIEVSPFFRKLEIIEKEFWLVDGSSIIIKTLSPEELVKEKIKAFLSRKKSRDLYDIFYLLDFCSLEKIKYELRKILPAIEQKPNDFDGLKELILLGKSPSFETIKEKVEKLCQG